MSNPVAPTGVDHVAINVPDVPGGIAFYTETHRPRAEPHPARLRLPRRLARHGQRAAGAPDRGRRCPRTSASTSRWSSTTCRRRSTELRARGLQVTDPVDVGTTGRKQAFTSDPWGNGIELHERPAG